MSLMKGLHTSDTTQHVSVPDDTNLNSLDSPVLWLYRLLRAMRWRSGAHRLHLPPRNTCGIQLPAIDRKSSASISSTSRFFDRVAKRTVVVAVVVFIPHQCQPNQSPFQTCATPSWTIAVKQLCVWLLVTGFVNAQAKLKTCAYPFVLLDQHCL
jgi:hypothetical protein